MLIFEKKHDIICRHTYILEGGILMVITFCGHSLFAKTDEYEQKMLAFFERVAGDDPVDFYLGGYGDFDAFAYHCCKKYQRNHPRASLIFVTPYISESYQKNHLSFQKDLYNAIVYPEIEGTPPRFAILARNRWMVERADYVVCGIIYDWGGAYKTYQHAICKNKPVFNICTA